MAELEPKRLLSLVHCPDQLIDSMAVNETGHREHVPSSYCSDVSAQSRRACKEPHGSPGEFRVQEPVQDQIHVGATN